MNNTNIQNLPNDSGRNLGKNTKKLIHFKKELNEFQEEWIIIKILILQYIFIQIIIHFYSRGLRWLEVKQLDYIGIHIIKEYPIYFLIKNLN